MWTGQKVLLLHLHNVVDVVGGVAKILCDMANELDKRGYKVNVVSWNDREGKPYFKLNDKIVYYNLLENKRKKIPLLVKAKREFIRMFDKTKSIDIRDQFYISCVKNDIKNILSIEKPNIVIAFDHLSLKCIASNDIEYNVPIISMVHGEPLEMFNNISEFTKKLYARSSCIQILLPHGKEFMEKLFPSTKIIVIPNEVRQYNENTNLERKNSIKLYILEEFVKMVKDQICY